MTNLKQSIKKQLSFQLLFTRFNLIVLLILLIFCLTCSFVFAAADETGAEGKAATLEKKFLANPANPEGFYNLPDEMKTPEYFRKFLKANPKRQRNML